MKIIDARGHACPKPLIMTRSALKAGEDSFKVVLDSRTAWENVKQFLGDNAISFDVSEGGGEYTVAVSTGDSGAPEPVLQREDVTSYCTITKPDKKAAGYVISFNRAVMGDGPEELGRILIQGFCNTIKDMDPLPKGMVFYNGGVSLALKSSPVLESLKALQEEGVKILVCGTCADFFNVKDQVGVGTISNMYAIMEMLTGAGHVVTP